MNVQLPARVLLGQCVVAAVLMLAALAIAPVAVWSICAGALCCVVPSAIVGQWGWRRGSIGMVGLVTQPLAKLMLSGAALAVVLGSGGELAGGLAKVDPLATVVGFAACALAQPVVLIWASTRRESTRKAR